MILEDTIFNIQARRDFEDTCLAVFRFQSAHCELYRQYIDLLEITIDSISSADEIPFLPIRFFKSKKVYAANKPPATVFTSSSTTGTGVSSHYVADVGMYERSFRRGFEYFYGSPSTYTMLALLPSYLERGGSSLIYMVEDLIKQSGKAESGFFLHNHDELYRRLLSLKERSEPTILVGVSFALLDFVEKYRMDFPDLTVMETGGMKGRRRELVREELHGELCAGFGVKSIHSEYGMTECLSQAYSFGNGIYRCPPWMSVRVRDAYSPLRRVADGGTGGVNIIDLANLYSCSFIETQDLGRLHTDGSFEVLGRFDSSDIRGCNLLV